MKLIRTGIITASLAAGLLVLAPAIHAQVLAKVSITATVYEQGAANDNNTTTTVKAATKVAWTTATLLKQLAADEFSEGNLLTTSGATASSATLPTGAALKFNGTGFEIDAGSNKLADVSDIMTWTVSGQNDINSGSFLDANGAGTPPDSSSDMYIVTVAFNDSSATGALSFTVSGLGTVKGAGTNPKVTTGNFTQSLSISFTGGTGEGSITPTTGANAGVATPFVISGFSISGSGSAAENDGNGTNGS